VCTTLCPLSTNRKRCRLAIVVTKLATLLVSAQILKEMVDPEVVREDATVMEVVVQEVAVEIVRVTIVDNLAISAVIAQKNERNEVREADVMIEEEIDAIVAMGQNVSTAERVDICRVTAVKEILVVRPDETATTAEEVAVEIVRATTVDNPVTSAVIAPKSEKNEAQEEEVAVIAEINAASTVKAQGISRVIAQNAAIRYKDLWSGQFLLKRHVDGDLAYIFSCSMLLPSFTNF